MGGRVALEGLISLIGDSIKVGIDGLCRNSFRLQILLADIGGEGLVDIQTVDS